MIEDFLKKIKNKKDNPWREIKYPSSSFRLSLPIKTVLLICIIFIEIIIISNISEKKLFRNTPMQIILLILLVYVLFYTIKNYNRFLKKLQNGKNSIIENNLQYLIETNRLFEEKKIIGSNEKKIVRTIRIFYKETEDEIVIRVAKYGDRWNEESSKLGSRLESSLSYKLDSFTETINYCQYVFKKKDDARIILSNSSDIKFKKEIDEIYLTEQMSFRLSKQPHILVAGITGSGKTTLLNYFIIELLKMNSKLFVVDPKNSDLSFLKHYLGEEQVVSSPNLIAKTTRLVYEEMENRFKTYKEDPEKFIYGGNFLDYNLNPVVLIVDELGALRASSDKKVFAEIISNLTSIILKGREMGVFVILSTQQPNSQNIPTELRDNLSVRISLGNLSDEGYRMVFGEVPEETVQNVGEGYVFLDGKGFTKPKKIEFPYVDYKNFNFIEEIQKLINERR